MASVRFLLALVLLKSSTLLSRPLVLQAPPAATKPAEAASDELRRRSFNLEDGGLALQGYDPISYLDRSGPRPGRPEHALVHRGVTYRFASAENRERFAGDPARYEPPYGGWCAWAVITGDKVKVDPLNYEVIDGKIYLFYKGFFGDAKNKWDAKSKADGVRATVGAADIGWKRLADADRAAFEVKR